MNWMKSRIGCRHPHGRFVVGSRHVVVASSGSYFSALVDIHGGQVVSTRPVTVGASRSHYNYFSEFVIVQAAVESQPLVQIH